MIKWITKSKKILIQYVQELAMQEHRQARHQISLNASRLAMVVNERYILNVL